jgi:hypothetical protein
MGSFSKMTAQSIDPDARRWFTFDTIVPVKGDQPIRVEAVHAGECNSTYKNDAVRRVNEQIARASNKLTPAQIDMLRDQDADIFARCIVKGWENVFFDDGTEPEFNVENIAGWLRAIPKELFDRFRVWAKEAENFRDTPKPPSAEAIAKK